MNKTKQAIYARWGYLAVGVVAMLFAGILYAWSILKAPLAAEFGWGASQLALNFTLAMSFFCIGGLLGSRISKGMGHRVALVIAGGLLAAGFVLTSALRGTSVLMLYITYGVLAGMGVGIAYNVIISTVSAWFPDKKGLCSGCLMMGFGSSALLLGNAADALFKSVLGWRFTYMLLGVAICAVLLLTGFVLRKPNLRTALPQPKANSTGGAEAFERRDYTTAQMLRRPSFWMAFVCVSFLVAVGSSVISFAKDLALSVRASEALAVSLVGVLSVCNGLGRILTGALLDAIGRRKTMLCANVLTMFAAAVTLLAVSVGSLPLCVTGLCLTGMSYGAGSTISAVFTSVFYGTKYYSTNMAVMTFTGMAGSLIATASNKVMEVTGGYTAVFTLLLGLTLVALILNIFIRKP